MEEEEYMPFPRTGVLVAFMLATIVGIYAYVFMNIYGIYNPDFKAMIASVITVADQNIPYFGRLIYSSAAWFVSLIIFYFALRRKEIRNMKRFNWLFVALLVIASVLSAVFP